MQAIHNLQQSLTAKPNKNTEWHSVSESTAMAGFDSFTQNHEYSPHISRGLDKGGFLFRMVLSFLMFLVCVQPFSTALFGVPSPHPTPQGRWVQHHRKVPDSCVRRMHKAVFRTPRQHRQTYEGRMPRDATRPEGQAAPPHKF